MKSIILFIFIFCHQIHSSLLGQVQEPTMVDLEYEVSLIAPKQLSTFTTIQDLVQDSLGFLWFSSLEGLHCSDGSNLVTYNYNKVEGRFGLYDEGSGYFRLAMGSNNILWALENYSQDIVGIDVIARKEIKRIKIGDFNRNSNLKTLENGNTYLVTTESDKTTYLYCVSCQDLGKIDILKNKVIQNYKSFNNEHWIHADTAFFQFDVAGNLINKFTDHPDEYLNWNFGDSIAFYHPLKANPLIFRNRENRIESRYKLPSLFSTGGFRDFKSGNKVWLSDLHQSFYIWNRASNTIQNYTPRVTQLLKDYSPSGFTGEAHLGIILQNGNAIYIKNNVLIMFSQKKDESVKFKESLVTGKPITSMRGLAEDSIGNIYASYYTGVSIKQKGEQVYSEFQDTETGKKEAERTYSLSTWNDKLIWNMAVFDINNKSKDYIDRLEYGQHVNHCLEQDTLWTYEWYSNKFMKYNLEDKEYELITSKLIPNEPVVSDIELEKETGNFWFATEYYGIMVYSRKGELVDHYSLEDLGWDVKKNNIFFIELQGDSVWFGTEQGLGLFNKETKETRLFENTITNDYGKPSGRKMYSMLKDAEGNFFLGTDLGISYFDKTKLVFQNLIPKHPLSNIEFNRNSTLKASDGKYYFGSIDGLYSFYPEQLKFEDDLEVPSPFLGQAKIYNKNESIPLSLDSDLLGLEEIKMKSSDTDLELIFQAPSLENEVYYRYMMPKNKEVWSNFSNNSKIDIISFPSGENTIKVRTYLRPNSTNFKEISIKVFKPNVWFKRLWVQVLLLFSGGLVVFYFIRDRYKSQLGKKEADAKLRTKLSSDLHDDVGSILSGIAMQSEFMSYEVKEDQKKGMNEISAMSREAMDRMRDIVWAIDSRKDRYVNLINRMRAYAEKTLSKKDIKVSFQVDGIDGEAGIDPESRQNYYLIFKEAITNIIKHSDATNVDIYFWKKGKQVSLSIYDNGTSKISSNGDGLGLKNMEMRASAIGGKLEIVESDGYKVKLTILK